MPFILVGMACGLSASMAAWLAGHSVVVMAATYLIVGNASAGLAILVALLVNNFDSGLKVGTAGTGKSST